MKKKKDFFLLIFTQNIDRVYTFIEPPQPRHSLSKSVVSPRRRLQEDPALISQIPFVEGDRSITETSPYKSDPRFQKSQGFEVMIF